MIASSTEPNGCSRIVESAASMPPAFFGVVGDRRPDEQAADDGQRYPLDAVAHGAEPPNRGRYAAIKILGEVLLHALHDLGDADADHDRADGGNQYLPERDTHQLRAESLLTLP